MAWKIMVDLDGVWVNFVAEYAKLTGVDMYAEGLRSAERWQLVLDKAQGIYASAQPLPDAWTLYEAIRHLDIEVLTAIPSVILLPRATNDKREWVKKYFGEHIKVNFGPYAMDKQYHCNGTKEHVLIDDSVHNKAQWESKGGTYILHTDAVSTIARLKELGVI